MSRDFQWAGITGSRNQVYNDGLSPVRIILLKAGLLIFC